MASPTALCLVLMSLAAGGQEHRNLSYGSHVRQRLDLTVPESDGPVPCVVFFHGGGFFMGDKAMHDKRQKAALLKAGIAFASANYRLSDSGPYPQPMEDAGRAVQFLRANAEEYGLDPERFAADGHSAGGAMALWLAYHDDLADENSDDPVARESTRLTCVAAGHCLSTFDYEALCKAFGCRTLQRHPAAYGLFGLADGETRKTPRVAKLIADASPISHLSKDDPDTFLYYGMRAIRVTSTTQPNVWVHHPSAGWPLVVAAKKVGVRAQIQYPGSRTADGDPVRFFRKRLLAGARKSDDRR